MISNKKTHNGKQILHRAAVVMVAAFAFMLISCDTKPYFKFISTPSSGWDRNDTLTFAIPKMQEDGAYSIDLGLRTNGSYPFMRLTLIVERTTISATQTKSTITDTLDCRLVDKNGNPMGQGVSYYQYDFHLADTKLSAGDSMYIAVRHDMKREILPGLNDIGIEITKY